MYTDTMKTISAQSAGAIIHYSDDKELYFLLVHMHQGHWGFPKGHLEYGETHLAGAVREVHEEVGLLITEYIDTHYTITDNYTYPHKHATDTRVLKSSLYFPARLDYRPDVTIQITELRNYAWCTANEALGKITHSHTRDMFQRFLDEYIKYQ